MNLFSFTANFGSKNLVEFILKKKETRSEFNANVDAKNIFG